MTVQYAVFTGNGQAPEEGPYPDALESVEYDPSGIKREGEYVVDPEFYGSELTLTQWLAIPKGVWYVDFEWSHSSIAPSWNYMQAYLSPFDNRLADSEWDTPTTNFFGTGNIFTPQSSQVSSNLYRGRDRRIFRNAHSGVVYTPFVVQDAGEDPVGLTCRMMLCRIS